MFPYYAQQQRPFGVTILVILQIITGVIDIIIGLALAFLYVVASPILGLGLYGFFALSAAFGAFMIPLAILYLILGLFSFALAYGLWTGQGWAWLTSVILALVGLVISGVGLVMGSWSNIIPTIIYSLIIFYLYSYNVRAFFGRAPKYWPPYQAPPLMQPPLMQPPPMQSQYAQSPYYAPGPVIQRGTLKSRLGGLGLTAIPRSGMCYNCLSPIPSGAIQCPKCGRFTK